MLANGAEFAGCAPAGPQKLDAVTGSTLGTNAFR